MASLWRSLTSWYCLIRGVSSGIPEIKPFKMIYFQEGRFFGVGLGEDEPYTEKTCFLVI